MKYRWIEKNVDLNRLEEDINEFFEKQGFKIKDQSSSDSFSLIGIRRLSSDQILKIAVIISGSPSDFSVELKTGGDQSALMFSSVLTFLGSGGMLLRDYKSIEFYQRVKDSFWNLVEGTVSRLAGSASLS
jgi:hypothetical protein